MNKIIHEMLLREPKCGATLVQKRNKMRIEVSTVQFRGQYFTRVDSPGRETAFYPGNIDTDVAAKRYASR